MARKSTRPTAPSRYVKPTRPSKSNLLTVRIMCGLLARVRDRCGLSPALTSNGPMPTRRLAILVGLPRRTWRRFQYSQTSRQRRSFPVYKHILSTRAMEDSIPTHHSNPIISIQSMESRRWRSRPFGYSRPSRPIRPSHSGMRIPPTRPHVIRVL